MSSKRGNPTQVAESVPFDNSTNGFVADNVQAAIEETPGVAVDKPRAPIFFWNWNSNPIYLYLFGQVRSNELPFVVAQTAKLRELSCGGRQNNTNANVMFAIYKVTDPTATPSFGSLSSVTNQGLTYEEGDFPYAGSTRVTIELVNNGPSLPLAFSEDLNTRTVTIQLETNGSGTPITSRTELRDAFRLNSDITLIYAINGSGGTNLTPATFQTTGGSAGDAIGSVFMRAKSWGRRDGYEVSLQPGDFLIGRVFDQDRGSFSPSSMIAYISFDF